MAVIIGLLFILRPLVQVVACPKDMENTSRKSLDILLLGNLLRRPVRVSKPSQRPSLN
jgi:hypothetical protein